MKIYDIVAFGEALIDFTPIGHNCFKANPGGAPYNLAVCASKCGATTAFMGKIGADSFGALLLDTAKCYGVAAEGFVIDDRRPTTHAFVTVGADGENGFVFCRSHGADVSIREEELDLSLLNRSRHFHFGGLSLASEPCRTTVLSLLKKAAELGLTVSFDPNYRPLLWNSSNAFAEECLALPVKLDHLKVSLEEARILSGETDIDKALDFLTEKARVVLLTMGGDGAAFAKGSMRGRVNGYPANVIDTTGAGDIFFGCFLAQVLAKDKKTEALNEAEMRTAVDNACRFAAKSTEKEGAIPSIPEISF